MNIKNYDPIIVKQRVEEFQSDRRPKRIYDESNPFHKIVKDALWSSFAHLRLKPENYRSKEELRELYYTGGLIWNLTDLLYVTNGAVKGMKVMDIGCGATVQTDYHSMWPPFRAEILTRLGANVIGADNRPNPFASYEHKIVDFFKADKETLEDKLKGEYDLIVASSLSGGLVGASWEKDAQKHMINILEFLSRNRQLLITDLDATVFGFKTIFNPYAGINEVWYKE